MSVVAMGLVVVLGPMALVALVNVLAAPRLHRVAPAENGPLVSVLIPARDEAANLRRLLPALARSSYSRFEVVVLDDGSRDESSAVVRGHAAADDRCRLVEGLAPPEGWTGKNWACHQLAHHARGDLFIFCDADVMPGPEAVGRTATVMGRGGPDVMTAFPRHGRGGWFEEAVVPMVAQLPIALLLPLPLVRRLPLPSLAVGNGQWFAWRRTAYDRIGGHARVRDDVLEDVRLARIAKSAGLGLAAYIATRDLSARMYHGPAETWDGFGKNAYLLAGGADRTALPIVAVFFVAMLAPLFLPLVPGAGPLAWLPLALLLLVRALSAALFAQPPRSVLLHPLGASATLALLLSSRQRHLRGTVTWKRRVLKRHGAS